MSASHAHAHHRDHGHHHGHGHGHVHDHGHAHALPPNPGKALAIGIALNLGFVAIEWGLGLYAHSLALLADATHNLSDVLGLVLAWIAARLALRAPSPRFTYGLGASSILAALANAVLLVAVTGGLVWEAVLRLQEPRTIAGTVVIGVALAGVVVNGLTAWLLHRGHEHDLNMRGAYLHMLADAAVSLAVAIAGAVILFTGWGWLDPAMTIVVGLVIVWGSFGLLRDSTKLALQGVPQNVDSASVRHWLEHLPGVKGVHDLHIWAMSTTGTAMTVHLVMPGGHPGDAFLGDAAQEIAHRFGIRHATLQVELGDCGQGCD
jgi:cobalt-zinc-cadmium efflux system protein